MARPPLPPDLPDSVRELIAPHLEPDLDRLAAVAQVIIAKRDEAKTARTTSGIETTWLDAEEAYLGIDDANRHEFQAARWAKPMSSDGPVTTDGKPKNVDGRSTVFVGITRRYVDAGAAKLAEILLPMDDKAFSLTETPVPEAIRFADNTSQIVDDQVTGLPLWRPARPGEPVPQNPAAGVMPPAATVPAPAGAVQAAGAAAPAGDQPLNPMAAAIAGMPTPPTAAAEQPPGQVPLTPKDIVAEQVEMAREKAKRAERRIYDWMVECQYIGEARKVIFDAARIGVGVLKGPFPKPRRTVVAGKQADGVEVVIRESLSPAACWVDPWNIFPDPACGENIHNGDYVFERDFLSERQVRDLKKVPGYIAAQIDAVIQDGPTGSPKEANKKPSGAGGEPQRKNQYEVWYYHGVLSREDYETICLCSGKALTSKQVPLDRENVFVIATMIGDRVVRATINPLDSGSFPYHSVPWQRRSGYWAGIGIAEQMVTPQRIANGATRGMLNNAGVSAGGQIVMDREAISPADGVWTLSPNKIWDKSADSNMTLDQAFRVFEIPNVTPQMLTIIQFAMRLAEETTSIPLITQGQSGPTQPDTLGGLQLQNNNANQLLRSVGYAFDDFITEPLVRQFYEWLLLDPDVPEDEKGDFTINAHGSAALVERAIQDQMLGQMLAVAKDPTYGLDPRKTMDEFLKSKRFDPRNFKRAPEEQERIDQQPPPPAPQVQAAQIRAEVDTKLGQQKLATEATIALHDLQQTRELALLEYANRHQITLEQVKAKLADTAMTLQTQERLAMRDRAADRGEPAPAKRINRQRRGPPQVAFGGAEPPGRAPNGRGFEA